MWVLYDAARGLCDRIREWVEEQPAFFEIVFVPAGSELAASLFPALARKGPPEELIAVTDDGAVYKDTSAWIMCLYALEEYRELAFRLSTPMLMPLARNAFEALSRNRKRLSEMLGLKGDRQLAELLVRERPVSCTLRPRSGRTSTWSGDEK
jgi:predicted DCC family thiol-disulfide oxidoreductase YuxK